jgi:hypothetical protein
MREYLIMRRLVFWDREEPVMAISSMAISGFWEGGEP